MSEFCNVDVSATYKHSGASKDQIQSMRALFLVHGVIVYRYTCSNMGLCVDGR